MDKISSIINSSRNQVDMSKERPVRAGAPSYGQPVSPASQTFQKIQKEEELMEASPAYAVGKAKVDSPDVMRHSGIIDKITFSFRGNSERPNSPLVERVIDLSDGEVVEVSSQPTEEAALPESIDLYA